MPQYYVSFGQNHAHAIGGFTYDKDVIGIIEAESSSEAHRFAMEMFEGKFGTLYQACPDMSFFPRGTHKIN